MKNHLMWIGCFFLVCAIIAVCISLYMVRTPRIEHQVLVTVPEGTSLSQTATLLEENNLVHSSLWFRALAQFQGISVKAGTYAFQYERTIIEIMRRLNAGDYGDVYVSVTFPEGITIATMGDILDRSDLKNFDRIEFDALTRGLEGYLFPDTYLWLPETDTVTIVETLTHTFNLQTNDLRKDHTEPPLWNDIIIMASIIEREANRSLEEQQTVSGILWKRIDRGIPLQVDAPFVYAIGKGSAELRTSDLTSDNPYNTYTHTGLPPTPIGNPGLSAIEAALNPRDSLYFFYLHDTNGDIHYGVTHDDHVRNKHQYL
ncbi:endolytic transglycosylase MltG [Patescibacteria group bacterium]|nr:endolytic transglycosylase MltG [Patescibacteria group bacterium]